MYKLILPAFIALISTTAFAQVNVGEEAPGFTYNSLENEEISLSDFKGKVVYIFFYGAGCPHCLDNGPITEEDIYQPFMDDTNFVALGLDTWNSSRSSNESFRSETGISYTLLLDAKQSLIDYYGNSSAYDRSVVISADSKIAYKGSGYVDTDSDEVAKKIKEELSKISTSTETAEQQPKEVELLQNYPNPFNPSTSITYTLNEPGQVSLKVYNILGAEIATLVSERQSAGKKTVTWHALNSSGSAHPSGLYIYQLRAGGQVHTKKMMLIK